MKVESVFRRENLLKGNSGYFTKRIRKNNDNRIEEISFQRWIERAKRASQIIDQTQTIIDSK